MHGWKTIAVNGRSRISVICASIWAVAAIGLASGAGLYTAALASTVISPFWRV
jgi:hypothetical protein